MKKFGLIGEKLGHSFSVPIHNLLGDYEYKLYEVEKEKLTDFVKNTDLYGFNITIPYKSDVMELCDEVSEMAREIGSVNTVIKKDGKIFGYNTDFYGLSYLLKSNGISPKGKICTVLGDGGASKTAVYSLKMLGAKKITVVSRKGNIKFADIDKYIDSQIIINATPVGMFPKVGEKLINVSDFYQLEAFVDMIYNPATTLTMFEANKAGIKAVNGLCMLVAQAKRASELFAGPLDDSLIDTIAEKIESEKNNIVLIGMPSCGKTTIGTKLAELTGRRFIDTDDLIEKQVGSIEEYIRSFGEEKFREIETDVLRKCTEEHSSVISCGGGVVTKKVNEYYLKQNGTVVFIKRDLDDLVTDNRPISKEKGIKRLAEERMPLYNAFADVTVENIGILETALKIKNIVLGE